MRTSVHKNEFQADEFNWHPDAKPHLWKETLPYGPFMRVKTIYEKKPFLVFLDEDGDVWICTKLNGIKKTYRKKWGCARRDKYPDLLMEAIFYKKMFNDWISHQDIEIVRTKIIEFAKQYARLLETMPGL